jgi:hypothetical protein
VKIWGKTKNSQQLEIPNVRYRNILPVYSFAEINRAEWFPPAYLLCHAHLLGTSDYVFTYCSLCTKMQKESNMFSACCSIFARFFKSTWSFIILLFYHKTVKNSFIVNVLKSYINTYVCSQINNKKKDSFKKYLNFSAVFLTTETNNKTKNTKVI